ncbi:MAG: ABC transporter substrate-binding protein [Candidatus Bipolaricaulia bacterium]
MNGEKQGGWTERKVSRRDFLREAGAVGLGAASIGVLSALSSSTAFGRPDTEVIFATSNMPSSLEPHLNGADIWQRRKPMIYENLTRISEDLAPEPQLAESWEQLSLTEYVFKVRRGVKFHNGQELDAEDAKYTYERVLDPDVGSGGAGDLRFIDKIEVLDKYTVRFSLKEVVAPGLFLLNLGGKYNGIIPKDFLPEKTSRNLSNAGMGTGPYKVVDFEPNEKIVLEKHGSYWQSGKPHVDRVTFQAIPDESSIVAGLRTGEVDITDFWDTFNFYRVSGDQRLNTVRVPSLTLKALDLSGSLEPTNDPRVRLAIQLGIDRDEILKISGNNIGQQIGIIPPGMTFWALPWTELPNQKRDVNRARELLAEAGYTRGMKLKLRNIIGYPALAASIQVIADQLRDVGLDVTIETIDIGLWIKDWLEFKTPPTMNAWGGFVDPDQYLYRHFHSRPQGADFRNWNDPVGDALLDAGRRELDRERRRKIYNQLQSHMASSAITIPLYAPDLVYSMQKSIQGFTYHPMGFYYGLRFIEKA